MECETHVDAGNPVQQFLEETLSPGLLLAPLSEVVAAQVVERLKQEADRHWGIDPHRSLEYANRIMEIGRARGDQRQIALGIMARGDALKFLGRTAEAWEALNQAGEIFQAAEDEVGWARTRIGRLYLSTMLNHVPQALADAGRARAIFLRFGEQEKLLRLELQIGYVHNYVGNQPEALERLRAALAIAQGLGEAGEAYVGPLYTNIGSAYETLGNLRQAQDYYERARALFAARGETFHLVTVETNIAYIAQAQGNYRRAIQMFDHTLEQAAGLSDLESAKIKHDLLECYLGLNRLTEARTLALETVAGYRQLNDAFELARVLLHLATIEAWLANYDSAQAALDEAEQIFSSLGATAWLGTVWLRHSGMALKQGDPWHACDRAREAAATFEAAGQQVNAAAAWLLVGQALLALENFSDGAQAGLQALKVAQNDNVPSLRYTAHLLLGQISEKQASLRRAERHYRAATATTVRTQRGLTITLQPGFLEDKTGAWRALIGLQLRNGRLGSAFETLEQAKSQILLSYLANRERLRWAREDAASRALIEELDQLRSEHQWLYRQAHEPAHEAPPEAHPAAALDHPHLLAEIRARERRMRAITEKLYLYSAEAHAVNPFPTPSLPDLQHKLDEGSLLIEFYNDGAGLFAFVLDRQSVEVLRLPIALETLNGLLEKLQVNLAAALKVDPHTPAGASLTQLARRILQRLYEALLAPLALHRRGKQRLIVVPYGSLHFLPFHLLFDGTAYLIERYETVILPAAGLALQPAPQRKPGAVIVAHAWEGRLPFTHREARAVQQLFGGKLYTDQDAGRSVFQEPPAQILHIAAHGQHRLDQPDLSYIQLADGQLYTDDLLQQDLSYELVTLSACETGRAKVAGGDELIGLGRGFLYAGAGALILSLWKVHDEPTVHLMEALYRALRAGASKAAALRAAQRYFIEEASGLHPAFWGAFQLVGDAGPLSNWTE
jgi:CHAT domain-containing protein